MTSNGGYMVFEATKEDEQPTCAKRDRSLDLADHLRVLPMDIEGF